MLDVNLVNVRISEKPLIENNTDDPNLYIGILSYKVSNLVFYIKYYENKIIIDFDKIIFSRLDCNEKINFSDINSYSDRKDIFNLYSNTINDLEIQIKTYNFNKYYLETNDYNFSSIIEKIIKNIITKKFIDSI